MDNQTTNQKDGHMKTEAIMTKGISGSWDVSIKIGPVEMLMKNTGDQKEALKCFVEGMHIVSQIAEAE